MIERTKRWISKQLALGEFASPQAVVRRSLTMAIRIAVLAYGMNVCAHIVLSSTGLLPYGLFPALVIATVLTPAVSLIVAFIAYYVVGMAVYDLGASRSEFQRMSREDPLTGLLNRRAFIDAYENASNRSALVLFDIDRFKSVNDTYGHGVGDDVIVAVASRLAEVFGYPHHVSRFGGEEFVILLRGLSAPECDALVDAARQRISEDGPGDCPVRVTASAGYAACRPGADFREMFAAADSALYFAKISGRNRAISADAGLSDMSGLKSHNDGPAPKLATG
jgi:diguanylate cyclase (GGDEF)-like protein